MPEAGGEGNTAAAAAAAEEEQEEEESDEEDQMDVSQTIARAWQSASVGRCCCA